MSSRVSDSGDEKNRTDRPAIRLLKKGVRMSGIYTWDGILKKMTLLRQTFGGLNSVAGEKLHDFEIISSARGCDRTHTAPSLAYVPNR